MDHELFCDNIVADSGELVHLTFLANFESVSWKQAINIIEVKDVMVEELEAIEENRTSELVDLVKCEMSV